MNRPVRPAALIVLTACALYPGLTFAFQGVYPFWAGEPFGLVSQWGPWVEFAAKLGLPVWVAPLAKLAIGGMWLAGVPGLWAGDGRAYPLVLLAAVLSLLYPGGPMFMGIVALVCLLAFRESPGTQPA